MSSARNAESAVAPMTIADRFEAVVALGGGQPAVVSPSGTWTYAELDARSDRLAALLPAGSADPAQPVALLLPHGQEAIVGLLAAAKAGRFAAALNPTDPVARLADHRSLIGTGPIVVTPEYAELARGAGYDELVVLADLEPIAGAAVRSPTRDDPDALAVLIMTSGTTGRSKAVMHSHRSALHNAWRYRAGLGITARDRIAWHTSIAGGQGLVTVLAALASGAALCPFPLADRGGAGLSAWLRATGVTVIDTLPSVLRHLLATLTPEDLTAVRLVRIASEPAYRSDYAGFRQVFRPDAELVHVLAASETGIVAQHVCSDSDLGTDSRRLPVGAPVSDIEVDLVGPDGATVSDGEVGEVVVRSRYLALGYWPPGSGDEQGFAADADRRSYRSADLAIMTAAGLVMQGRSDLQVKVRGQRVQLDEVDAALLAQAGVQAAATVPVTTESGDLRLCGFVVPDPGRTLAVDGLRAALATQLPAASIPHRIENIDRLPLTATGKVDRDALVSLATPLAPAATPAEPVVPDDTAERVAALWSRSFGIPDVARDIGFLSLGGDSLLAAVIGALGYDEFGVVLDMAFFRANPTIETMAAHVDQLAGDTPQEVVDALPRINARGPVETHPLSLTQLSMWRTSINPEASTRTNVAVPYRLVGALDPEALRRSLSDVVRRHDLLRTSFELHDGEPRGVVHSASPVELQQRDLRAEPDPAAAAAMVLRGEAETPFDLATGPLIRFTLLRLRDAEWQLVRVSHHLLADTWSWGVFLNELGRRYELESGHSPPPPEPRPALQFADYVAWEHELLASGSPIVDAEVDWWQDRLTGFSADGWRLPVAAPADPSELATPTGTVRHWGIAPEAAERLDAVARDVGATYFDSRLATVAALLGQRSGARDLAIEAQVTTRRRTELQSMIGPLMNRVLIPLRFDPAMPFRAWLREVHATVTAVGAHGVIPAIRLREELGRRGLRVSRAPLLFQSRYPLPELEFGGVRIEAMPRWCVNPAGFELGVTHRNESNECWAGFDAARYDPSGVDALLADIGRFANAVGRAPEVPLIELEWAPVTGSAARP